MTSLLWNRRETLTAAAGIGAATLLGGSSPAVAERTGRMRFRGVVYDVGLRFVEGQPYSVEPFDPALVKYDIHAIAKDLHANAVRIEGEEIDRLVAATRVAHAQGLTVFFNPWKMEAAVDALPAYFATAARAAEQLREEGIDIVFVTGCETPIFNKGIFPGATLMDRIGWLSEQFTKSGGHTEGPPPGFADKWPILNRALAASVKAVRAEFKGLVTYAATGFEDVDWSLFDIVGVDYYRQGETAQKYVAGLDRFRLNKPLVVMEVGSCAYTGAAARGAGGFMVLEGINPDGSGKFAGGVVPTRNEREQANYVGEVLELLDEGGVDGTFIYVFSFPSYRFGEGAKDLDMVSFSLVKTFAKDDPRARAMPPWAPKDSFFRIAEFYRRYPASTLSSR